MLRILVISDTYPNTRNRTSILFETIRPRLNKKIETKILWLCYGKKDTGTSENYEYEVFHIGDFKTSKEVLEKIHPSLIYLIPGMSVIEQTFLITAKISKIPTFQWAAGIPFFAYNKNKKKLVIELIRQFFENKKSNGKSEFRGKRFLENTVFFLKSLKSLGKNYTYIIAEFIHELKIYFYLENRREGCDLNLVENEFSFEFLKKNGIPASSMVITGDPTYDLAFTKIKSASTRSEKKIEVLFLTVNLTSGQGESDWTVSKRNLMIQELITEYKKFKENVSLKIKIHPTSENYLEYKKLLDSHKIDIHLYQHEDIYELIAKSNVILTTSASTAAAIGLIMKKPVVVWNYFHVKDDLFLNHGVVIECSNAFQIKNCLLNGDTFMKENQSKINEFIEKYFGSGNAIQTIVTAIEERFLGHKLN